MNKAKSAARVGIVGSYGGLNLGDEAILQSIVTQLKRSLAVEFTIFSRDANDTRERFPEERVVPVRKLARSEVLPEIQRLHLLLLGGGGILYDAEAKTYLREAAIAREMGVPVMIYAIGAGPLHDPVVQSAVRDGLRDASVITVRERNAQRVLEEAGIDRDIIVTADPALLLKPEPLPADALKREGLDTGRCLVGMSVREPGIAAPDIDQARYHTLLANAADFMVDRFDAHVVFVPMERQRFDLQHSHAVVSQMLWPQRASVLKGTYTPGQLLTLVGHFSFAVGMRLHFLIFAALQGVPFVALPYSTKVSGFLDDVDVESPPLQLVNAGRLIAHIDECWDKRRTLVARIKRALPDLQQRAMATNEIVAGLLKQAGRRDFIQGPAAAAGAK